MISMFQNCESLKYLNLSVFDISNVSDMSSMFSNCKNLQYINLENAIELDNLNVAFMFNLIRDDIIYCIDEEKAPKISALLKEKTDSKKDCSLLDLENDKSENNSCNIKEFFEGMMKEKKKHLGKAL